MDKKGFSLVELMISLTVLAVGLLALAQMQIVAIQGSAASRKFTTATNLARLIAEEGKTPGAFLYMGSFVNIHSDLENHNTGNDAEASFAPDITANALLNSVAYDWIQTLVANTASRSYDVACAGAYPSNCNAEIPSADFVRVINARNVPPDSIDDLCVMKELNVIVLWKEAEWTRSVNIRTLIARKDYDFF